MSTITATQSAPPLPSQQTTRAGGTSSSATWRDEDLYRMTFAEYERIGGMLDDPDKVELIDGVLVRKMSKNPRHVSTVKRIYKTFDELLPIGWTWQKEDPIRIPDFNEPEPDVTVLRGTDDDYVGRIPESADVAAVIEASESSLDRDRGPKLLAYSRARIPVYWIVNLVDNQIEVYSDPTPEGYRTRQDFKPGQNVPVVVGGQEIGRIKFADILP